VVPTLEVTPLVEPVQCSIEKAWQLQQLYPPQVPQDTAVAGGDGTKT
jgi:hypothetical protein